MMQQPYNNGRNQQSQYNQQQLPMQQQQQRSMQQQQPYQQQNMMPQQQYNRSQQQPMMMDGRGGGYQSQNQSQNQPQNQPQNQSQGMYNQSGGMYNNQQQMAPQQSGRQQQMPQQQQQGYLNQQPQGNYQQSSLVVSANNQPMGMQQQRMQPQQQQQPMMMQQQQPMMMTSQQQQQQPMMQQPMQSMVGRFPTPYGVDQTQQQPFQAPQLQYDMHPQPYMAPQAPQLHQQPQALMQQQQVPMNQQPVYSYAVAQQPQPAPMQTMAAMPAGYLMGGSGPHQPTSSLVVAEQPPPPAPTLAYVSQASYLPQHQATLLNPLASSTTSYLAVQQPTTTTLLPQLPHSQATIQVQPQQPQHVTTVVSGQPQPGSLIVHQPALLHGQPQQAMIVSAAPANTGPTFTTDQLQAAAAAAAAAAIGLPPPSSHGILDPSTLNPQQQQLFHQMQLQHQAQHLKKMRQRLPHVSGAELRTLQKQIGDLQQQQQLQQLQTLRLQQKQEQQAFKYLNKAIKTRPSRTYQSRFITAKVFNRFDFILYSIYLKRGLRPPEILGTSIEKLSRHPWTLCPPGCMQVYCHAKAR